MKEKTTLNVRKSKIALILVLILLLQIITPIMRVQAETNTLDLKSSEISTTEEQSNIILKTGDSINCDKNLYIYYNVCLSDLST